MLVVTRKRGEAVRIGDGITVSVTAVRQGKVLLGIDAPDNVPIVRTEIEARPAEAGENPNGFFKERSAS